MGSGLVLPGTRHGGLPSRSSHLWKQAAINRRTSALSLLLSCGSISGILILLLRLSASVGGSAAVLE